jgi:hypothetical protein
MARSAAAAGSCGGRGAPLWRPRAAAASAGSWARPRQGGRPAAAPGSSTAGLGRPGPAPARRRCAASGRMAGWPGRWPWRRGCGPRPGRVGGAAAPGWRSRVGLVGEEDLEAVPVVVGAAQLRAGVGVFPPTDPSGALRPAAQVDPAGQLDHLGASPDLAVRVDRGVQAASGWARIASRRWASIGMPRVKATSRSRRCQASLVLAPALSLRTRTG